MKKFLMIFLCLANALNGADIVIAQREPREWDAQAYEKGCDLQTTSFLQFLKNNDIKIENRRILDVGCGTGKLSTLYAETAKEVHGIDASKEMINCAKRKYTFEDNLSFEQCFVEDLIPKNIYQLALVSSAFHWFEDKKQAVQNINNCLEKDGELFCDVRTMENPKPNNLIVAGKIISQIPILNWFITEDNLMSYVGSSYPTNQELRTMLIDAHFDILRCEEQSFEHPMTKDEIKLLEWPIINSRPIMPYVRSILSEKNIQYYFDQYVDLLVENLPINKDGKYIVSNITTIVHARKK